MSNKAIHERHRSRLENLASDDVLCPTLQRLAESEGLPDELSWRRLWGRIDDPQSGRARLVFEADDRDATLCTVEVGVGGGIVDPVLGPLRVTWFPYDERLPTLGNVMAENIVTKVVRYRPGKRCTLRTGGWPRGYVKVFADERAERLYLDGEQLWNASQRSALRFAVARPLRYDRRDRCYVQAEVAGRPIIDELYGPNGVALAHRLGAACASIPNAGLKTSAQHTHNDELERTRRRASEVIAYVPALEERTVEFLAAITELHGTLNPKPLHPIHGSPHPNQWLQEDRTLGLVDFDRLGLGDPELDVATFAAEVDFETVADVAAITAAFEEGYREHYGPLDQRRLLAYRAHKRFAKVYRTVRAVRVDGDRRAAHHLEAAAELLPMVEWR